MPSKRFKFGDQMSQTLDLKKIFFQSSWPKKVAIIAGQKVSLSIRIIMITLISKLLTIKTTMEKKKWTI